ncbi:MAG: eL32 family ribosomal protein [Candidatus Altiarchaeota archaeon]
MTEEKKKTKAKAKAPAKKKPAKPKASAAEKKVNAEKPKKAAPSKTKTETKPKKTEKTKAVKKTAEEPIKEAAAEKLAEEKTSVEEEKTPAKKKVKEKIPKPIEKIENLPPKPEETKKTKPRFVHQELSIRKRIPDRWRRPRGIDSKQIEGKRGKGALPSIGYGSPKKTLGLHPSGLAPVRVRNIKELSALKEGSGAIIASQVGRRKRNIIIKEANKLKITVLNPRKGEA